MKTCWCSVPNFVSLPLNLILETPPCTTPLGRWRCYLKELLTAERIWMKQKEKLVRKIE